MRKIYIFFILFFGVFTILDASLEVKFPFLKVATQTDTTIHKAEIVPSLFNEYKIEKEELFYSSPDTLTWKLLGIIKYIKKPNKDYPDGVMFPIVNSELKAKNKKKIVMSGFIVPIDNVSYALSKNVFAACFFCGKAGPETIMGIKFRGTTPRLKTDQYVALEGNFRYNDSDVNDWIYHIEDAVIVKGGK
jgi:hypothetical protein